MIPAQFIQQTPHPGSVKFAGVYLNLRVLARHLSYNPTHSHLSRIFSSDRDPSLRVLRKLAEALNMTPDQFLEAIQARKNRTKVA